MAVVDNQRRYLAANAAARLLFRLSLAEFHERRLDDLTPADRLGTMSARWADLMRDRCVCGPYEVRFPDATHLRITYCALADVLPGQHLIVLVPADWPDDELPVCDDGAAPLSHSPLTPREREVLTLVAGGADVPRIARELTIAPTTARTHVRNALRKLGARNRAHAIALAMSAGLIDHLPKSSGSVTNLIRRSSTSV